MPIWSKYKIIKEIDSKLNIKTYLTRIEPVIKEIIPKDKDDYYIMSEKLENLKEELNINEKKEENEKIYLVLENNEEILSKVDRFLLSDELNINWETILQDHGNPISKEEIFNLFKLEKSMCKIPFESTEGKQGYATGLFCEIDNFIIKFALLTNNHVLNESNIEKGNTINIEFLEFQKTFFNSSYQKSKKPIEIKENRRVFTNKNLDYTCIELFESDGIKDFFKIKPKLFKHNKKILKIIIFLYYNFLKVMLYLFHMGKYYHA